MAKCIIVLWMGFLLDVFLGDPEYRFHPIRLMGHGISFGEKWLRKLGMASRPGGIILALVLMGVTLMIFLLLFRILNGIYGPLAFLFQVYVCFSCLALRDLTVHLNPVVDALESGDLDAARHRVSRVVGRDVTVLDEKGVCRAAVETLAENFIDGFVSPLFWYLAGGLLGWLLGMEPVIFALVTMLVFKVVSTMDSMVGYKNAKYEALGWAGAKLDDVMNFIPARLSFIFLFPGAVLAGCDGIQGIKIGIRDRLKHESPNSAHGESFVAGALGIRLAGPAIYGNVRKEKPWLGEGFGDATPADIVKTMWLLCAAAWVSMGFATLPLIWIS
ncbi:MAG: cobalamin biosynthesis protein CobD [Deltaproteobacteria bacterium]|jgi:adenosylcobinamide-phosphate synthase|nr:cobalamin biosynthesis protein CobD [Deltaproteobacteria bacterium]MBT6501077.1 cobalamin biosynthesis protein CobD [Deltaproteobacteria bacterium]